MDRPRTAAERVRPMLQAMERSIDAARQRRLRADDVPADAGPQIPPERIPAPPDGEPVRRLKARPKRPSPLSEFEGGSSFHSRAS